MLVGDADYATNATDSNSANHGTGDNIADSTNDVVGNSTTKGFQGIASDLMMRYRESLINIDVMILNELQEMFMLVWDNGDEYMSNGPLAGIYSPYSYGMIGW
jgi:hypothetical protein